jgi:predicted site-specific integrase-resolvase
MMSKLRKPPTRAKTLSRAQVAAISGVSPSTVSRWGREGRLPCIVTLGGQQRYFEHDVAKLAEAAHRRRTAWKRGERRPPAGR